MVYLIVLFVANAVSMILELCASRIFAPAFGNENEVWTAIIGIILVSNSVGNWLGGKIADKHKVSDSVALSVLLSSIFTAFIALFPADILRGLALSVGVRIGAVIASIILFLLPSACIGVLTPVITKYYIAEGDSVSGKKAGTVSAVSTVGSLLGTFVGGFFLIPTFGARMIVIICAGMLFIMGVLPLLMERQFTRKYSALIPTVIACLVVAFNEIPDAGVATNNAFKVLYEGDTQLNHVLVQEYTRMSDGKTIRQLNSGNLNSYSSKTYITPELKYETPTEYIAYYYSMIDEDEACNMLMIGGGGYSLPKHIIANNPNASIDVVEIDAGIVDIARKYFYLDDLIKEYNTEESGRLGLYTMDGRVFLNESEKKYDYIMNDGFSGGAPVASLATEEFIQEVHDRLNDGGYYMSNVISSLEGENSKFLLAEMNTISKVFRNVWVVSVFPDVKSTDVCNLMVYASDSDKAPEGAIEVDYSDGLVLTDDYVPIDAIKPYIE